MPCGLRPQFMYKLENAGIRMPPETFSPRSGESAEERGIIIWCGLIQKRHEIAGRIVLLEIFLSSCARGTLFTWVGIKDH